MGAKIILKGIAILALGAALFSCRRKIEAEPEEYTPLSKAASDLSSGAQWAYEIESGRLDKKIDSLEAISKNVSMSPLAALALRGAFPAVPIYPQLDGFGSLDVSSIQGELLETIKEFCSAMIEYSKNAADYERYAASEKKQENSPKKKEDKKKTDGKEKKDGESEEGGESVPKKDSSKIDALFSKNTLFSLALFLSDSREAGVLQSFVIGRPFVGEELMEVPVRWTGEKKFLHTRLYPVQEGESWKIQQIEIYKSEEKNGSVKTDRN